MKALSLRQPWANMVAREKKTIETRTWSTKYRGTIAIHAAKSKKGYGGLHPEPPYGAIVALAYIYMCRPMQEDDEHEACCKLYPGAWAWHLSMIRPVEPVFCRGMMGLFEIDIDPNELVRIPTCKIPGCGNRVSALGYCTEHFDGVGGA